MKALTEPVYFSKEVNIPALMTDMSIRLVVAPVMQDDFGRRASQLEILPLALTAATNLAII